MKPGAQGETQGPRIGSAETTTALVSASCGLAALALYALTAVRGVGWDDAAELSVGIDQLGIVHQTGYPAYLLLAKAFTILEPLGSVATRTNLFSAATAAATVWLAAHFIGRSTRDPIAAVLTGVLLATGSIFWSQARVASVYPLFLLAIVAMLVALRWWDDDPQPKRLAAVAVALGLVCVSHKTGILFLPFVGVHLASRVGGKLAERWNLLALAAILIPLATLLYVPLRWDAAGPQGTDITALQWITGTAGADAAEIFGAGLNGTARRLAELGVLGVSQLSVAALVLVPFGLWSARRDRLFIWCAVAPAVLTSLLAATTIGSFGYWHLPFILAGALAAGYGIAAVRAALPAGTRVKAIGAVALALAAMTGAAVGIRYAIEQNLGGSEWARAALSELPQEAYVRGGWTAYSALRATQKLEGLRPDVRVVEQSTTTPRSLGRSRGHHVVATVPPEHLRAPPDVRLEVVGPTAPTNVKGASGLEICLLRCIPDTRAVMFKVVDRRGRGPRAPGSLYGEAGP